MKFLARRNFCDQMQEPTAPQVGSCFSKRSGSLYFHPFRMKYNLLVSQNYNFLPLKYCFIE